LLVDKDFWSGLNHNVVVYLRGDYSGKVRVAPSPSSTYAGSTTYDSVATTYLSAQNLTRFTVPALLSGGARLIKLLKDGFPPAGSDLAAEVRCQSIVFSWGATGDDGTVGGPVDYEIRSSSVPLTDANFAAGTVVSSGDLTNLPDNAVELQV